MLLHVVMFKHVVIMGIVVVSNFVSDTWLIGVLIGGRITDRINITQTMAYSP